MNAVNAGWRNDQLRQYPLPKIDPKHLKPTRVEVLRGFCVEGKPVAVGDIVTVPAWIAADLVAVSKAKFAVNLSAA